MQPAKHALLSIPVLGLTAYLYASTPLEGLLWIALGTIASVSMDLDHFLIASIKKEKRRAVMGGLSSPLSTLRGLEAFKREIDFPGFSLLRLLTHLIETLVVAFLTLNFSPSLSAPLIASMGAHLISDLGHSLYYREF